MFIDTHCHLDKVEYANLNELLNEIKNSNVEKIIVNGCDIKSNKEAIELARKYNFIYATVGFHPEHADEIKDCDWEILEEQLKDSNVVALGEIGLDYHWNKDNKEKQKEVFKRQLFLADKYNKPVIIHSRDAMDDMYDILKNSNNKGIMHCFSGTKEDALKYINLGYLLGIGGIITFKNADNIREVIKNISLEYIVLETDSPYLAPEPFRGQKNTPLLISYVADRLAEIKKITPKEVGLITSDNARRLFDLKDKL
jgi:TatD DNase family protein